MPLTFADGQRFWVWIPGPVPLALEIDEGSRLVGSGEGEALRPGTLVAHHAVVSASDKIGWPQNC